MLSKVKNALRITVNTYDSELSALISAAVTTLNSLGITASADTTDAMIERAIITFVRANFGTPDDYEEITQSFNSQVELLLIRRHSLSSSADTPGTDDPGTDTPGTDDPGTDTPGTDDPGTDTPGTDDPGTDTPGTDDPEPVEPEPSPLPLEVSFYSTGAYLAPNTALTVQQGQTDEGRAAFVFSIPVGKMLEGHNLTITGGFFRIIDYRGYNVINCLTAERPYASSNYTDFDVLEITPIEYDVRVRMVYTTEVLTHYVNTTFLKNGVIYSICGTITLEEATEEESTEEVPQTPMMTSSPMTTLGVPSFSTAFNTDYDDQLDDLYEEQFEDIYEDEIIEDDQDVYEDQDDYDEYEPIEDQEQDENESEAENEEI